MPNKDMCATIDVLADINISLQLLSDRRCIKSLHS